MTRKRSKIKKVTADSRALKKIREDLGLSQSQLARRLNISKTSVNHYENGWSAISEAYIDSFLKVVDYPRHIWEIITKPDDYIVRLRADCHSLLESLDTNKLKAIHSILTCL